MHLITGYIAGRVYGPHYAATDRGGGPGSYTKNGVRCTMDAPFAKGMKTGEQHDISGDLGNPFDAARTGGGNGLPTRVTDEMGGPKKGGTGPASETSSPGAVQVQR